MSQITIICQQDADPRWNRLQLRTTPPTYIELLPGVNVLRVEDYPDLIYGFKQLDLDSDHTFVGNCQEVISVDLSQFDGSEMTSMEEMFYYMQSLETVKLDGLDTSSVQTMDSLFSMAVSLKDIDMSGLDTSNVEDMNQMCWGTPADVDLSNIDVSNVKSMRQIFGLCCSKSINLTGWQVNPNCDMTEFTDVEDTSIFQLNNSNIGLFKDEFIVMNKFKLTENAKRFSKFFRELDFFESVEECLNSIPALLKSDWTPNVYGNSGCGLDDVNSLLSDLKSQLSSRYNTLLALHQDATISHAIKHNLEFILKHSTFYLVTKDDEAHMSADGLIEYPAVNVTVNDCFVNQKGGGLSFNGTPLTREIPVPSIRDGTKLGVYIPTTGTIMLWIDRIRNHAHPVLVFQKVLVHEIIHALMDISPREILSDRTTNIIGDNAPNDKEETYDNTLVLQVYQNNKSYFDMVKDFISNQPPQYRDALNVFVKGRGAYVADIKTHLSKKIDPNAPIRQWNPQYSLGYNLEDDLLEDDLNDYSKILNNLKQNFEIKEIGDIREILIKFDPNISLFLYGEDKNLSFRLFFNYNGACFYDSASDKVYTKGSDGVVTTAHFDDIDFCKVLSFIIRLVDTDKDHSWKDFFYNPES